MKTTRELQPRERACANAQHDLLLQILSNVRKCLIHSIVLRREYAEETNQKQKIRKLQNENICLTNLNVENNGNFPILAFRGNIGVVSLTKSRGSILLVLGNRFSNFTKLFPLFIKYL